MSIVNEIIKVSETGVQSAEVAALCVILLSMNSNGKGRYWLLVLFIVAVCAAFYFLLYLYR